MEDTRGTEQQRETRSPEKKAGSGDRTKLLQAPALANSFGVIPTSSDHEAKRFQS